LSAYQHRHADGLLPSDADPAGRQRAGGAAGRDCKSYSSKGQELVERNWQALALARESLAEVPLQQVDANSPNRPPVVSDAAPDFVKTVTAAMLAGLGDALPVSALPPDGTWPMGTTRWEKRNIAEEIPIWKEACTQCPLRGRLPALGNPRQSGLRKRWKCPGQPAFAGR
jgi:pyruvate-ferredoxin/flavodoxin oxidoreductase